MGGFSPGSLVSTQSMFSNMVVHKQRMRINEVLSLVISGCDCMMVGDGNIFYGIMVSVVVHVHKQRMK